MQAYAGAPTEKNSAMVYVAIELSQRSWVVVYHSPDRDRLSHEKLEPGDVDGLLALMRRVQQRAARALGYVPRVTSCYEAGYDGFWLHRRLIAEGIENVVIDPASLTVDRRARRAKTDRIDGEQMVRALMAYWRGEPRVLSEVRVPSCEEEDARRRSRERERLVKEHTAHVNRIKALLRTFGMAAGDPRRPDWTAWLEQQRDAGGKQVPVQLLAEVTREHQRLQLVREQIDALAEAAPASAIAKTMAQLMCFKGLGPVFAGTLAAELFWKTFNNRREVGAYSGLTPSPWKSGSVDHDQGISKAGNRRVRHVAVELAWLWLRHQPKSALSRAYEARVAGQGKRVRRIAIVALARKLLIALWRYLTTGLVPTDAVLKA
jgi:transposase